MGSSVVETTGKKKLSGTAKGYLILFGLVVLSWLIFKILTPSNFGSPANMLSYFQASLIATVGAVGFYFVMVMGMFDFSIGANIMLSAIVGCVFASRFGMGYAGLIIGSIVTGSIVGLLNGVFYVKLPIPSMIVTTGLALIYESVANYIAGGVEQTLPSNLRAFGQMPGNIILAVLACVVAYIFLNYTKIGTYTYAIGSNEFVAKNMGINVDKAMILGGIVAGAFFGYAGVIKESYAAFVNAQSGLTSLSTTFQPMAAALLALALASSINVIIAVPISTFLITLIFNVLTLFGVPSGTFQDFILGVIVILFAILAQRKVKGVVK